MSKDERCSFESNIALSVVLLVLWSVTPLYLVCKHVYLNKTFFSAFVCLFQCTSCVLYFRDFSFTNTKLGRLSVKFPWLESEKNISWSWLAALLGALNILLSFANVLRTTLERT